MVAALEQVREYAVILLDVIRRRWVLLCVPVGIALVVALVAVKLAPTKYVATSLILLQGANRTGGTNYSTQRMNAAEQIGALEAWLKSDQVLLGILPEFADEDTERKVPDEPARQYAMMEGIRRSLTLDLIGGSVLAVRLEGQRSKGLAKRVEVIVARLMEGLIGPEQNIFSAPQFVLLFAKEEKAGAELALARAAAAANPAAPEAVKAQLKRLAEIDRQLERQSSTRGATSASAADASGRVEELQRAANDLRRSISPDPQATDALEQLYSQYERAQAKYDQMKEQSSARANYVGIFEAPQNLLVIGRPNDPLVGESAARKFAIAGVLLSLLAGGALIVLAELFEGRLRTRREFEAASGLPVVGRIGRLSLPQVAAT